MMSFVTGAFKRLTLKYAIERDQQEAFDRVERIKWEQYEAAKAELWRKLELNYLREVNELQQEMLSREDV